MGTITQPVRQATKGHEMSEPSKEAMSLSRELLRSGLPAASNYSITYYREEALALVIDREFAALRARAEAADLLEREHHTAKAAATVYELAEVIRRLRARAEAADALASALVAIKTEHANYTSVHGSDEDDEQAVALADAALAAYEKAKEVKS